jgi:hypothetical protein
LSSVVEIISAVGGINTHYLATQVHVRGLNAATYFTRKQNPEAINSSLAKSVISSILIPILELNAKP